MTIRREWAMPSANTYSIPPIKRFVEKYVYADGVKCIIDPFANHTHYGTIRNDLNPSYDTDFHLDALQFLQKMESNSADVILYDPPYSPSQAKEVYDSFGKEKLETNVANMRYWSKCKKEVSRILKVGGKALTFGWSTNGIGKEHMMRMEEILLVCHGGGHNDTICCAETKTAEQLELF